LSLYFAERSKEEAEHPPAAPTPATPVMPKEQPVLNNSGQLKL